MSLFWTSGSPYGPFSDEHYSDERTARARRLRREEAETQQGFKPRMNLYEDKEKNVVTATFELPGLKKDDIAIDLHNGRLTVSGEVKAAAEENKDGFVVRERPLGRFSRVVSLPQGAKPENIAASMADGVLTVTFPKSTPEQEAKRIAVN